MRCFGRFALAALVASALFCSAEPAEAAPIAITGFAAMGASETQGNTYSGSWVPYLAVDRNINFGLNQTYNRAVGGSTSLTLLTSGGNGQHTQVANLVQAGSVNMASIFIGGLDIQYLISSPTVQDWANAVSGRIATAVDKVLTQHPAGMLVWGIPDMTLVPGGQIEGEDETKELLIGAIDLVNSQIKAMALDRNLVFIDTAQAMRDFNAAPLVVGGVAINVTQGNTNPRYFFQDDIHPGAVGNGVFANMAIAALNIGYGQSIDPLSDQLILQRATLGSSYTGQTSNLPYANYVYFNAVPEPATVVLFGSGLLGVAVVGCRRAKRRAAAANVAA